jgi:hypothetical protein
MKYSDGVNEIRRGDRVRLYGMQTAVVVLSVDTGEYSDKFPEEIWKDELKGGILLECDNGTLVHLDDPDWDPDPDPNAITQICK